MSDHADTVLICVPATAGARVVPGSARDFCHACDRAIWVAPTGQEIKRQGARTLCIPCGEREMEESGETVSPPLPEQIDELRRARGGEA